MGWFDWVFDALSFVGIYYRSATILFLGLDNAGKTTLLGTLKDNTISAHTPTFHPITQVFVIGNVRYLAHDLGGHEAARRLWKDYLLRADGVVYLVDAVDRERFAEARKELGALLSDDILQHVPFLVLGNKIDNPMAVSEFELRTELNLLATTGKEENRTDTGLRPVELFMCSVVRKMGYSEGFQWLAMQLRASVSDNS